jgi:hypothetical protein
LNIKILKIKFILFFKINSGKSLSYGACFLEQFNPEPHLKTMDLTVLFSSMKKVRFLRFLYTWIDILVPRHHGQLDISHISFFHCYRPDQIEHWFPRWQEHTLIEISPPQIPLYCAAYPTCIRYSNAKFGLQISWKYDCFQ